MASTTGSAGPPTIESSTLGGKMAPTTDSAGTSSIFMIDASTLGDHLKRDITPRTYLGSSTEMFRFCNEADQRERKLYVDEILKEIEPQEFWTCIPKRRHPFSLQTPDPLDCNSQFLYNILICIKLTRVHQMISDSVLWKSLKDVVLPQRSTPRQVDPIGRHRCVYLHHQLIEVTVARDQKTTKKQEEQFERILKLRPEKRL